MNTVSSKEKFIGGVIIVIMILGVGKTNAAELMVELCAKTPYRPYCYEKEVPNLLDYMEVGDVFDVIRQIRVIDSGYQFCHVLAHELGEREVAKDPENWIDAISGGPTDGLCSNGFIHGAAVERFTKEVLSREEILASIPDLQIACEPREGWNPTPLDQAMCYHGVGHILLHLTDADIGTSLEICDAIAQKGDGRNYQQVCDEGVFMQIFQPLEPEDFALVDRLDLKVTKDTLPEFCGIYDEDEEGACLREAWPLYDRELNTAEEIGAFCELSPNDVQTYQCYVSVVTIKGRHGLRDPDEVISLCNNLPDQIQGLCFERAAAAHIEEDKSLANEAVSFCAGAKESTVEAGCYEYLINIAHFVFGRESIHNSELCDALPQPWGPQCVERIQ